MKLVVASLLLSFLVTLPARPAAVFEVASIRAAPGATVQDARFHFRGDRFEAKAATVGDLSRHDDMLDGKQYLSILARSSPNNRLFTFTLDGGGTMPAVPPPPAPGPGRGDPTPAPAK
jgi:hypothetical protein